MRAEGGPYWEDPNSASITPGLGLGSAGLRQIHFSIKNLKIQLKAKRTTEYTDTEVVFVGIAVFIGWFSSVGGIYEARRGR